MKDFIIIGSKNTITYKEIFPLIKEGVIHIGITHPNRFLLNGEERSVVTNWYNTLGVCVEGVLTLSKSYYAHPEDYPKYDNFDAIEVSRVKDIPYDYEGLMGVPITFLEKYCPTQFEIVGLMSGAKGENLTNGNDGRAKFYVNGKGVYARILIKKK